MFGVVQEVGAVGEICGCALCGVRVAEKRRIPAGAG